MGTRTSRINALRGFCREFDVAIPAGVPELIRGTACALVDEIRLLEARVAQLERQLAQAVGTGL